MGAMESDGESDSMFYKRSNDQLFDFVGRIGR